MAPLKSTVNIGTPGVSLKCSAVGHSHSLPTGNHPPAPPSSHLGELSRDAFELQKLASDHRLKRHGMSLTQRFLQGWPQKMGYTTKLWMKWGYAMDMPHLKHTVHVMALPELFLEMSGASI